MLAGEGIVECGVEFKVGIRKKRGRRRRKRRRRTRRRRRRSRRWRRRRRRRKKRKKNRVEIMAEIYFHRYRNYRNKHYMDQLNLKQFSIE